MDSSVLWIFLAAAAVALLAVITVYLVLLIQELRGATREVRSTLARLTPELELTLANARRATESVALASDVLREIPPLAQEVQGAVSHLSSRAPLVAGAVAAFKLVRWLFRKPRTVTSRRRQ